MSATLASAPPKASAPRAAPPSPAAAAGHPLGNAAGLPRISTLAAHALNRAYAWPTPLAFAIAQGHYELRWQADAEVRAPGHIYTFRFGPAEGRFVLDSIGEHALIGDAASDSVPAEIRSALVADALAPLIDALEARTRHRIELGYVPAGTAPRDDPARDPGALRFCVTRPGSEWRCHGALCFTEERYLGLACPAEPPPPKLEPKDFDTLPIALRFLLGSTMLSVAELHSIARGDIIGIERWQSSGPALHCFATTSDGHVTVWAKAVGSRIVIDRIEENPVTPSQRPDAPAAGAPNAGSGTAATSEPSLTQIDALEVRVTFELDERSMPLAQLKALKSGYVIELEQPLNQSTVHIRANGALVGQGHLIAVGNKLGVRVSRFSEGGDE
ncbi:type III secretion system cytoplasmic ring protein SctQ [Trinickia dinghuensis]|uniref:YscQ/HrcQ family type III secretion apparatus protein n=1 Tax=Trinickia dinghuensis TaxID=2291023 RepID=A0A3D8JZN5_9BURK|nr:type III secretion system cytoplasmic ring protein SctQ [Trinickia dinghuensis]RDU98075.1 YscQ/HrcQ family type III secretion apparatus protein [Trinickia dinghuensis]